MSIKFSPNGMLDISTDPMDLPIQQDGNDSISGAMTRCTNLHLDHMGIASTRRGSQKTSAAAMGDLSVKNLIEQSGIRYAFSGGGIYENESSILSGLTDAEVTAMLYNAYTSLVQSVFMTNGTDRKRVSGSTVNEWGIDAPAVAPICLQSFDWSYTSLLTPAYTPYSGTYFQHFTTTHTSLANGLIYECVHDWEPAHLDAPTLQNVGTADTTTYKVQNHFETGQNDLQSTYQVVYTYCRKNGDVLECESNPSPVAYTCLQNGLIVKFVASSDPQVTHYRVYRTLAAMGDLYYMQEVDVSKSYLISNMQDDELGGIVEIDHYRPPLGGGMLFGPAYSGSIFLTVGNNLYYSKPKQPEYWPTTYYVEVSPQQLPLIAGCIFSGQTFVASVSDIYQIQGTGPSTFFPLKMAAICGTISKKCFCPVIGQGIYHLSSEGIFLFKIGADVNISEDNFSPVFHGESKGSMPGMNLNFKSNCWMISWRGKFYFGYPGGTDIYPRDLIVTELSS